MGQAPDFFIIAKLGAYNSSKKTSLKALVLLLSVLLQAGYVFFWVLFISSLALALSACLLLLTETLPRFFVSDITDVTQSSGEMTYFGSSLDLAPQGNNYCYDFLCNLISFLYSALNSSNTMEQSFLSCLRGTALATFYVQ